MSDLYIARQPIVDRRLKVFAFELLFRPPGERDATAIDHEHATSAMLLKTFVDGGPEDVVDGMPAFVNVTPDFVERGAVRVLPTAGIVVEVDRVPDEAQARRLWPRLDELRADGYRFSLDGFGDRSGTAAFDGWIARLDYLKVSVESGVEALTEIVTRRGGAQVIASRVETYAQFERCRDLGAMGFQGYFLSRPQIVGSGAIRGARQGTVQALSAVALDRPGLEAMVRRDPVLSYRLLRVANSSFYNRGAPARSIRRAIDLLGTEGVKQWIALLAAAQIEGKPRPLLDAAMIRARACELLAQRGAIPEASQAFLVGMFSLLDALMDRELEDLLDRLPVGETVRQALLERRGPLGELLECAIAQERGVFEQARLPGLDRREVQAAYLDAIRWARDVGALAA